MYFIIQGVVRKLIPDLEKYRNAELAERKEKRKKQQAADKEAEKNNKDEKDKSNTTEGKTLMPFIIFYMYCLNHFKNEI